jgi:hypothetical protein
VTRPVAPRLAWALALSLACAEPLAPAGQRPRVIPAVAVQDTACAAVIAAAERTVRVASSNGLASAIGAAAPGTAIVMAAGTYTGYFHARRSGTASAPIALCGARTAVVQTGHLESGNAITLHRSYWRLVGFSVTNSQVGISGDSARFNTIEYLDVHHVGQAGIHLRRFSKHNTVRFNTVRYTGRYRAAYGEGVYIGTYDGAWCSITACKPDRSDSNAVTDNSFSYVTAQHVDVKEGSTGTEVRRNRFDGRGMTTANYTRSWVFNGGNGTVVTDNRGSLSVAHGFEQSAPNSRGWGVGSVYRRNVADVGAWGYGFNLMGGSTKNTVGCDNTVTRAGSGYSNVACSQ